MKYLLWAPRKLGELILTLILILSNVVYGLVFLSIEAILAFASFFIYGYKGSLIFYKYSRIVKNDK